MAQALPFMQAAGTVMQVFGALNQGDRQAQVSEYNAGMYSQQAQAARQAAGANAAAQEIRAKKTIGKMRGAIAASGITLDGSALDVMAESAAAAELDRLNILHGGEMQAMGFERSGELERRRAMYAREEGWGKAGSALLTGAAKFWGDGGGSMLSDAASLYGPRGPNTFW